MKQPFARLLRYPFLVVSGLLLVNAQAIAQAPANGDSNLLKNGNFEKGMEGWEGHAWNKKGIVTIDTTEKYKDKPTLRIDNPEGDDTMAKQKIAVTPNTRYRLSGYIKTKNVVTVKRNGKDGATLMVVGGFNKSEPVVKSKNWTRVAMDFATGRETEIELGPRLGFYSAPAIGTAWFADLTLKDLGRTARK